MTEAVITLILDGTVALLLAITIFYCGKLNTRIRLLQDSKSELAQLIQKFDDSTQQATRSIAEIHTASKKINESIQAKLDKANYIADDLSFMIERGNKLADQMEGHISSSRGGKPAVSPAVAPAQTSRRPTRHEEIDIAEEIAREATPSKLEEVRRTRPQAASAQPEDRQKRASALESVLEKISAAKQPKDAKEDARRKVPGVRLRSQAEQELMDALKPESRKA